MSQANTFIPHYTIADYEQWPGEWELWNGVPIAMTPAPNIEHQRLVFRLAKLLDAAIRAVDGCHCEVVPECEWRIAADTVVRPDVSVICEPVDGAYLSKPPVIAVEVLSPSTAGKDRVAKRRLFAEQGVAWYLLADHANQTLESLRLTGDAYEPASPDRVDLHPGCDIAIDAARLWA